MGRYEILLEAKSRAIVSETAARITTVSLAKVSSTAIVPS